MGSSNRTQYNSIRDTLFHLNANMTSVDRDTRGDLSSFDVVLNWLRSDVVGQIFQESTCGDGFCEPRDELPLFSGGRDARAGGERSSTAGLANVTTGGRLTTLVPPPPP